MKPYDKQKENDGKNMVSEPEALYGNVQQHNPIRIVSNNPVPKGYMTLDEFGELFHQKLDDCYAQLQNDNKQ
ncbi:MAG: hypothetical protein IJT45_07665 [Bacteroidales bacterium]|jgi:hypothetical protein|nr:hypothetical protein [Bacteroidales bacterium]MBQ7533549.1 hypothetical protein [Bacteroidales bacterium]